MFNGGYRERLFEHVFCQGELAFRGLYVTNLVAYTVFASILNAVHRTCVRVVERKYLRGNIFGDAFCSLRSHGTRFAYGRLRAQALSQPCLVRESNRLIQDSRL